MTELTPNAANLYKTIKNFKALRYNGYNDQAIAKQLDQPRGSRLPAAKDSTHE